MPANSPNRNLILASTGHDLKVFSACITFLTYCLFDKMCFAGQRSGVGGGKRVRLKGKGANKVVCAAMAACTFDTFAPHGQMVMAYNERADCRRRKSSPDKRGKSRKTCSRGGGWGDWQQQARHS